MKRKNSSHAASQVAGSVMDPRKLLYLATVVEEGSLTKAAEKLAVSQPALSKSMVRLERELGKTLLERGPAGITPTPFGELVYAHARSIRDEMGLAHARIHGAKKVSAAVIRVGTLPSLSCSVVPLAVSRWKIRHPRVLLRVVERVQIELLLGLLRHEFDFVIGQTEFYDVLFDGLKQRVLFRDRLCVFASRGHPLFGRKSVSWSDLAAFPWVCPMVGWPQRTVLEKLLASEGLEPPTQWVECASVDFTKSLVASSDHLALLPTHAVASVMSEGSIRALSITVPALKRDIAVIFPSRQPLSSIGMDLVCEIEMIGTELAGLHA